MKVTVSSLGKFCAFQLAEQLNLRNALGKLLTSFHSQKYPWLSFLRNDSGKIEKEKIKTFLFPSLASAVAGKIAAFESLFPDYRLAEIFDYWASRQLEPCDIVVPFATYGLKTIQRAKQLGTLTVLERGSPHVEAEIELIQEEQKRWNISSSHFEKAGINRQIREYEEADYIAVPSQYAKNSFLAKGINPDKILVCPLGADFTEFQPAPKQDDTFRILYVGWLNFRKGILYLLEAFRRLKLKDAELWLIGKLTPEMKESLKPYANFFRYLGTVPSHALRWHYSQGSVLVLPTISDGFGLVLLQAMACELPVITTTNSGGPDIFTEGKEGFLVPIRSIEALCEKILFLYENPEIRSQMGEAAREQVLRHFTWDSYGNRVLQIYASILNKAEGKD